MNRDQKIQTSLSAAEKAQLETAARQHRRTVADYTRLAILYQVNQDLGVPEEEKGIVPAWADPPPAYGHSQYHVVTDAIADVIEHMAIENYESAITFWKAETGDTICEPCNAICHLLLRVQGGLIKESVIKDAIRHLQSIAPMELIRHLNGVMWPCSWLPTSAFDGDPTVVEIADELLFTPDLNQAKAVFSALADQTLPGQRNHRDQS